MSDPSSKLHRNLSFRFAQANIPEGIEVAFVGRLQLRTGQEDDADICCTAENLKSFR